MITDLEPDILECESVESPVYLGGLRGRFVEKEMATHSSILTWKIPKTEEPGGLQSIGSQRVERD